jgi:Pro-kumamolisin, activation domain
MPAGQDVGPTDPNQQIEVTVYLQHEGGKSPSAQLIGYRPISERHYVTREEYARFHGARTQDVARVLSFTAEFGLRVASEDRAARRMKLTAQSAHSTKPSESACGVTNTPRAPTVAGPGVSRSRAT